MEAENEPATAEGLTLAIVGCGKMGTAILSGILLRGSLRVKIPIRKIIATVQSSKSAEMLRAGFSNYESRLTVVQSDNPKAFREADVVLLACKPYMVETILREDGESTPLDGKLLISVVAGWPPAKLLQLLFRRKNEIYHITRASPNIAASIGSSMTAIEETAPAFPERFTQLTTSIFEQIGFVQYVSPDVFDVSASLVGAGIALLTVPVEGMLDGAVAEGLKRDDAKKMLAQTLKGLAELLESGQHPAIVREQITSPRGTTIRGLLALEAGAVRSRFSSAIMDCTERARKL